MIASSDSSQTAPGEPLEDVHNKKYTLHNLTCTRVTVFIAPLLRRQRSPCQCDVQQEYVPFPLEYRETSSPPVSEMKSSL